MSQVSPSNTLFDSKVSRLKDRAALLKAVRDFFYARQVTEVDCPIISAMASVDTHIDLMPALYRSKEKRYLHSSPEMGMKRLLAEGIGDIYQLSHVFRDGEWSVKHNPEFTMVEWYRIGFNLEQLIEETTALIRLFLGNLPHRIVTYREVFLKEIGIDYVSATPEDLFRYIQKEQIPFYPNVFKEGKNALLNLILGSKVEPKLGIDELTVLAYYPASQAALAKKRRHGEEEVADRFEVYFKGVELCNGFHELTDAQEQRLRFQEENDARIALGKDPLPPDEHFIKALEKGLPECSGVAVGIDRLLMLRQGRKDIADVLPFGWKEA